MGSEGGWTEVDGEVDGVSVGQRLSCHGGTTCAVGAALPPRRALLSAPAGLHLSHTGLGTRPRGAGLQ